VECIRFITHPKQCKYILSLLYICYDEYFDNVNYYSEYEALTIEEWGMEKCQQTKYMEESEEATYIMVMQKLIYYSEISTVTIITVIVT